ncbi:alpha/beta fold hydrolase [Kibdelosporangium aridum]|uniref:Serine aminopeptidase, S33 n=1 Tax=Kibdelosporangium aridum TaxID=2030 RepID=A0A1W2FEB2_KIBAR|nr:alpha/beta hydrolase [Kibdelosporangium aridum]SMD20247.1 Serine aminopeptidase, S33 [Kibdelosporangium aridum]
MNLAAAQRRSGDHLIVFMHGIGCAKESYAEAFDAAELKDFSLCAFDFPGHGESPSLRANSVEAYADASVELIESMGPGGSPWWRTAWVGRLGCWSRRKSTWRGL